MVHDVGQGQWFRVGALDNVGSLRPLYMLCAVHRRRSHSSSQQGNLPLFYRTLISDDPSASPPLLSPHSQGGDMGRPTLK